MKLPEPSGTGLDPAVPSSYSIPVVHNQLRSFGGCSPGTKMSAFFSVGHLIIVSDQANGIGVTTKLDDGIRAVSGHIEGTGEG